MIKKLKEVILFTAVGAIILGAVVVVIYGAVSLLGIGGKGKIKKHCELNEEFSSYLKSHKAFEFSDKVEIFNYGSTANTYVIKKDLCNKLGGEEAIREKYNAVCFVCADKLSE